MSAFDFKKEYANLYKPGRTPGAVDVPAACFFAVSGRGDPNEEGGAYSRAVGILYALSYTVKMSKMGAEVPEGYFEYVMPPLEGLWQMKGVAGIDYSRKADFEWTAMIRQPDFVTRAVFDKARDSVWTKKKIDASDAAIFEYTEGLCVQCMHIGPFDDEPETVRKIEAFIRENGYACDFSPIRRHHEIYLGDPRKTAPEKLRTILRHPVRPA